MRVPSYDTTHIERILHDHIEQMSQNLDSISNRDAKLFFTNYDPKLLKMINEKLSVVLSNEPTLLEIDTSNSVIVVGDLHGHIIDLYRILTKFDLPPRTSYLFLGDMVDRGGFSLELITLLFVLKLLFPSNIYMIRGNHEFESNSASFKEEIIKSYNDERLYASYLSTFSYIPLAAKIGKILCLHGGIGGTLDSINQIREIKRPILDYSTNSIVENILWSDPVESDMNFRASARGRGCYFSQAPFMNFIQNNNLTLMVRAHECVDAFRFQFDKKLITIFSASSYIGENQNHSGVVVVNGDSNSVVTYTMEQSSFLSRNDANFNNFCYRLPSLQGRSPKRFAIPEARSSLNSEMAERLTPIRPFMSNNTIFAQKGKDNIGSLDIFRKRRVVAGNYIHKRRDSNCVFI